PLHEATELAKLRLPNLPRDGGSQHIAPAKAEDATCMGRDYCSELQDHLNRAFAELGTIESPDGGPDLPETIRSRIASLQAEVDRKDEILRAANAVIGRALSEAEMLREARADLSTARRQLGEAKDA